ncbi:MAG TPA: IS256 family transposase, partial [Clostridiales bacterium]|nr:IS256 family transposase [Clostridiales bacterium]
LIAVGFNEGGQREIIGFHLADSESETSWSEFFQSLKSRGLKEPRLITSDNHAGLVAAVRRHFQGSSWQGCQTHFSRNLLDKAPKSLQPALKEDLRQIYEATDEESARAAKQRIIQQYEAAAPKAMDFLDQAFDDITAVLSLPLNIRKRLRTTNGVERLNQEIRRRERVIRIFPNELSAIRLMGALLIEHDEKWSSGRIYLNLDIYHQVSSSSSSSEQQAA